MTEHARTGPTRFQLWSLGAGSWEPICFWQFSSCFPLEDIASLPSRLGNQKSTGGGWRGCISQPAWLGIPLRILPPEAKHGTPVVTPWPDSPVFPNARPKSETLTWQTPLMSLNPPRSQTQVISMMGTAMTDTTHPGPGHLQEAAAVVTPVMTPATHTVHTSGCAYAHVSTGVCLGGDHHLGHASSEGNMAAKIVSPIVSVVVVTLLGAAASYFRLNSRRNCFRTRDKGLLCLPGWSTIG
ncbi:uncharacterized protein LOC118150887 isoform X10 [Callithrix jacchus]